MHRRRFDSADETGLASDWSKVGNPNSGAMMAGDAEIAFERRKHLDLACQHRALDLAMRMNREAVLPMNTVSHLAPHDFALANLRARPARGLGLART